MTDHIADEISPISSVREDSIEDNLQPPVPGNLTDRLISGQHYEDVEDSSERADLLVPEPFPLDSLPEHTHILINPETNGLVYLIGTTHIKKESADSVEELIRKVNPHHVMLELCRNRIGLVKQALQQGHEERSQEKESNVSTFSTVLSSANAASMFHNLLAGALSSMTKDLKYKMGVELIRAVKVSRELNITIVLGDRPIDITFARLMNELTRWEKTKIVCTLLYFLVTGKKVTSQDLEELENMDLTEALLSFREWSPGFLKVLVDERDLYLSASLKQIKSPVIVGVVGRGHIEGIKRNWHKTADLGQLLTTIGNRDQNVKTTSSSIGFFVGASAMFGCVAYLLYKYMYFE